MKSRIVIILFIITCTFILTNTANNWKGWVFKYDKSGYHLHLPAMFIYHDIEKLAFYKEIDDYYKPSGDMRDYGLNNLGNGNRVNKYNIGVAVLELPFFLVTHFINKHFIGERPDGYSMPYQWGAVISNLFWAVIGLFLVRRFLLRYFSDNVTAITLLLVAFGTNFYNFVAFSPGMSHSYSFTILAMILLQTDNIYTRKHVGSFIWMGIAVGFVAITRSSNLIVLLIPLLWGINSWGKLVERFLFFVDKWKQVLVGGVAFLAIAMLQMSYWKYITNEWIYDGYIDEGFIWTKPAILKGLFSFQKGWFVYTPLATIAVIGLYSMRKRFKEHIPAIVIYMSINIYIIFSWWCWWYGGGFGARPLVEAFAILSLPMAAFTEEVMKKSTLLKALLTIASCFLIFLNMFQSYQSYNTTIHWDHMSRAYYFQVFLKPHLEDEDRQYLMSDQEFYDESAERLESLKRSKE